MLTMPGDVGAKIGSLEWLPVRFNVRPRALPPPGTSRCVEKYEPEGDSESG